MKHALLRKLPGRAIVIGVAIKLLVFVVQAASGGVPAFLGAADSVAGLAIAAGGAYFAFRLLVLAKRRLLWRVRRKLILSYIFIGFVPALLIVAFFLLCGLLLFFTVSSYLVQTELRALEDRVRFLATSTALEIQRGGGRDVSNIVTHKQATADLNVPELSMAVVGVERPCGESPQTAPSSAALLASAGPWAHMSPPSTVPAWIGCSGFSGLLAYSHRVNESTEDTHMLVRALAFPDRPRPGYAVIVDLPITEEVGARIRSGTGVEVIGATAVDGEVQPTNGRAGEHALSRQGALAPTSPFDSFSFLEYVDWEAGRRGTLVVSMQLSIAETYTRISVAQGFVGNQSYGQLLLIVLFVIGGLFLVTVFVALIAGLALAKSITGSVHEIFVGTERVRQGDFTHKIAVTTNDQLGELAGSFNQMTASIEDLLRQAAEKKRLEEELRIAHEIQMSLLPQGPLRMPGVSVTALCVPAREVGGDYYDFFPIDARRLGVLIADVSGKGTSAALYMAELKGLMLSLSRIHTSPRELLITANRIIADHLDARSFITMIYAILDLEARTMTYARAGHTPLIYVPGPSADSRPSTGSGCPNPVDGSTVLTVDLEPAARVEGRKARVLAPGGLVLGLKIDQGEMFARLLEEETIPLGAGDLYLFFTDGISEAMNAADDCFGESRLAQFIEAHVNLKPDELRECVLREIEAFVGDAPQHDDMTMILLKVDDQVGVAETVATTIDAETVEIAELR